MHRGQITTCDAREGIKLLSAVMVIDDHAKIEYNAIETNGRWFPHIVVNKRLFITIDDKMLRIHSEADAEQCAVTLLNTVHGMVCGEDN